jgi:hypothetical protein
VSIRTAITQLMALEQALTITVPTTARIKRAYFLTPDRNAAPETPCWMHTWDMPAVEAFMGDADAQGTLDMDIDLTINAQLFVKDADIDRGAAIATAFHEAFVVALARDATLGGTVYDVRPRGGIRMLEWAGVGYPGLDLFLDTSLRIG